MFSSLCSLPNMFIALYAFWHTTSLLSYVFNIVSLSFVVLLGSSTTNIITPQHKYHVWILSPLSQPRRCGMLIQTQHSLVILSSLPLSSLSPQQTLHIISPCHYCIHHPPLHSLPSLLHTCAQSIRNRKSSWNITCCLRKGKLFLTVSSLANWKI